MLSADVARLVTGLMLVALVVIDGFGARALSVQRSVVHDAPIRTCSLPAGREHPYWPISSVTPPLLEGYCKHETDVCPSIFLPLDRIVADIRAAVPNLMSNFVVNIGAKDGVTADPVYPILEALPLTGGVFIEAGDESFDALEKAYSGRFRNAQTVLAFVSPSNAALLSRGDVARARNAGTYPSSRRSLDVLKIDIDGCDCHILGVMLAEPDAFFHAKVIQVELNHAIPPPLVWKDMCLNDAPGRSNSYADVWGCSMQAAYDLVRPLGYELLQYDWPDAVFIKSDIGRAAFPCIFLPGSSVGGTFERSYWVGYEHAAKHYSRFTIHQSDRALFASLPTLARAAAIAPHDTISNFVATMAPILGKRPLWVEVGVSFSDSRIQGNVTVVNNEVTLRLE